MSNRKKSQCEYLGNKCVISGADCSELVRVYGAAALAAFTNHHIDENTKSDNYENLIRRIKCTDEILDELDKCVLVQAHLHNIITAQKFHGEMTLGNKKIIIPSGLLSVEEKQFRIHAFFRQQDQRLFQRYYVSTNKWGRWFDGQEVDDCIHAFIHMNEEVVVCNNRQELVVKLTPINKEQHKIKWSHLCQSVRMKYAHDGKTWFVRRGLIVDENFNITHGPWTFAATIVPRKDDKLIKNGLNIISSKIKE